MSSTERQTAARALIGFLREEIPLAQTMDLSLHHCDAGQLVIAAPLQPNINDKGCAFGGSLVSVMTLACWSLVELELRLNGYDCDVFVADSSVRYLQPVWGDFHAAARLGESADWATFFHTLQHRGRARTDVTCLIPGTEGKPAATLKARFVAKRRAPVV